MARNGQSSNLNVKISQSGREILQRVLSRGDKLTIGKGAENDIVQYGDFPKRHVILNSNSGGFSLNLVNGMSGEIWIDGSKLAFADLIRHNILPRKGKSYLLQVTPEKRGFVKVGDTLIEFSPTHDVVKGASLGAGYSWVKDTVRTANKDLFFKSLILVGLVLEVIFYSAISKYQLKEPEKVEIAKVQQRFAKFVVQKKVEEPVVKMGQGTATTGDTKNGKAGKKGKTKKKGTAKKIKGRGGSGTGSKVIQKGILGLIGGMGASNQSSSTVDFLIDRGMVKDMDNLLSNGLGGLKKGRGGLGTGKGSGIGDGTGDALDELIALGSSGGIDDLLGDVGGVESVSLQKKGKVNIAKPNKMRGSQQAMGQRNAQSVMRVINSRQAQVQYTYNKYMKGNPNLRGKVSLEITIEANGRVSRCRIVESTVNHPDFERDLINIMKRLKFPPISAGSITVNIPLVFQRLR